MKNLLKILFVSWAVMSTIQTLIVMTGPDGLQAPGPAGGDGVLGLYDPAVSPTVEEIRRLLAPRSYRRVYVVLPPIVGDAYLRYIDHQLAHLEYPTRIRVIRAPSVPEALIEGLGRFEAIVVTPGVAPGAAGAPGGECILIEGPS